MASKFHLWPEERVEVDGKITVTVTIENSHQERKKLWYRIPAEYGFLLSDSCDPFVAGTILFAMQQSAEVAVHGSVSPSLLKNLTEFQAVWACWRPGFYKQVEISAEVEREQEKSEKIGKAIAAFSGGVDSCFTIFRHHTGKCGRLQHSVQAGLMVHGFDISLNQQREFDQAVVNSREILASRGVELIPLATNYREFNLNWEDVHGCAIASALMLLQKNYDTGLIGSFLPYQSLKLPWGTNPITDSLLSSQSFQIIHDGASFTRLEKIREIASWPEARARLRVCWEGDRPDQNCGRCEKCIRTILAFRALGEGLPPCFTEDVSDSQILGLRGIRPAQLDELILIREAAKNSGISDSWVQALGKAIGYNRHLLTVAALKQTIKKQLPLPAVKKLEELRSRFPQR